MTTERSISLSPAVGAMGAPTAADIVYIGYPKAASTFVEHYLAAHDDVTVDRDTQRPLFGDAIDAFDPAGSPVANRGRIHVSINEKVAESVLYTGDHATWRQEMFTPGAWEAVQPHIRIDPIEAARRIKNAYPDAKVLIVIREQVDWLHSAYRYFLPRLPAGRRSFADFCATPRGIVYLAAGHFDITIAAYADAFGAGKVRVLRFEDLVRAPERFAADLAVYIGLDGRPPPKSKANEGSTVRAAAIRKRFPFVDALPPGIRRLGGRLVSLIPGKGGTMFSDAEVRMIRSRYAASNGQTKSLLARLGS